MRAPTCVHFELAGHSYVLATCMLIEEERVERKLLSRARGERCLAAVSSSKQIGVSRASDLQWIKGRALSNRSFIEAERAIFAGARGEHCLTAVSSSKQIGASRASDLQWSEEKGLSRRQHA